MNQRVESILDELNQERQEARLREESSDRLEDEYSPFTMAFVRVFDFPYDEPWASDGDDRFNLMEDRFSELGSELFDRGLYPWLCNFNPQEPIWNLAVTLLIMACKKNTTKGKIAEILRALPKREVFQANRLSPGFSGGGSKTITYGTYKVWEYLKTERVLTPPMNQPKLAHHAGVKLDKIQYWMKSKKLDWIGEGHEREWIHDDEDQQRKILKSIQSEMLPKRKESQKSPKKRFIEDL